MASRPSSSSGRPSSRGSTSRASVAPSSSHAEEECFNFPSITDRKTAAASSSSSAKSSPNYTSFNDLTKQTIELTEPYKDRGGLTPRRKKWKYGFDAVFNPEHGQGDVWEVSISIHSNLFLCTSLNCSLNILLLSMDSRLLLHWFRALLMDSMYACLPTGRWVSCLSCRHIAIVLVPFVNYWTQHTTFYSFHSLLLSDW